MKKRLFALLFVFMLSITGCSTNDQNNNTGTDENNVADNLTDNTEGNNRNNTGNAGTNSTDQNAMDNTQQNGTGETNGADMNQNGLNNNQNTTNQNAAVGDGTEQEINYDGDNSIYKVEDIDIISGKEALNRLKAGNARYVNNESELINVTDERREDLYDGQNPYAVIVSCSDSRVTPTTIFNAGLGEIFDVRLAGNILTPEALGSIEYGVEHLHAPLLVIIGHEKCGAVTAAYDKMNDGVEVVGNINTLVEQIEPAIQDASDVDNAIHMNIDYVYNQVLEDEIVKHLVDAGKLTVVSAYYSLNGQVTFNEQ